MPQYQLREYVVMGIAAIIAGSFIHHLGMPNGGTYGAVWSVGFMLFGASSLVLALREALQMYTGLASRPLLDVGTGMELISAVCFVIGTRQLARPGPERVRSWRDEDR